MFYQAFVFGQNLRDNFFYKFWNCLFVLGTSMKIMQKYYKKFEILKLSNLDFPNYKKELTKMS